MNVYTICPLDYVEARGK